MARKDLHGYYWLAPLLAAVFWTATLLGLLLWWIIDDKHRGYMIDEPTVVYISDVGAAHKELFIPGTALTFAFYSITLLLERYLRHVRRLPGTLRARERWSHIAAVGFGILGGLALLMLSIFNAFEYETAHWILTLVFVVCVAISAVAQTLQVMWLERDHPGRNHLRRNAIIKLVIVSFAVAGAIAFAGTFGACTGEPNNRPPSNRCNIVGSVAAAFEWFIAFLFDAYLLTFILDLWPARHSRGHKFDPELIEKDRLNALHYHKDGTPIGVPTVPAPEPSHVPESPSGSVFREGVEPIRAV